MNLDVRRFALAGGIYWGLGFFFLGIMGHYGWGTKVVDVLSSVYIGYSTTFIGAIIGGIWGFVDALIAGALFAWLYNRLLGRRAAGSAGNHLK